MKRFFIRIYFLVNTLFDINSPITGKASYYLCVKTFKQTEWIIIILLMGKNHFFLHFIRSNICNLKIYSKNIFSHTNKEMNKIISRNSQQLSRLSIHGSWDIKWIQEAILCWIVWNWISKTKNLTIWIRI